jgi:hypothetical protein
MGPAGRRTGAFQSLCNWVSGLAAIRTYLSLGFLPYMLEADHAPRWHAIFAELDAAQSGS